MSPAGFHGAFVEGSAPPEADREKYRTLNFRVTNVDVSGDSATAVVEFLDANGAVTGKKDWTLVRVDDFWHFKSAPLP